MAVPNIAGVNNFVTELISHGFDVKKGATFFFRHKVYTISVEEHKTKQDTFKLTSLPRDTSTLSRWGKFVHSIKSFFGKLPEQKTAKLFTKYFNIVPIRDTLMSKEMTDIFNERHEGLRVPEHEKLAKKIDSFFKESPFRRADIKK